MESIHFSSIKKSNIHEKMCKHELLAAVVAGEEDSIFLPVTQGLDVPHPARRFVSPTIAATHSPHVGTHKERT